MRTKTLKNLSVLATLATAPAYAQSASMAGSRTDLSFSAIWIFANLSYAGMRAQGRDNKLWRILSFVCGFPGTLLTLLLVKEGSEHAYGVDLPSKRR